MAFKLLPIGILLFFSVLVSPSMLFTTPASPILSVEGIRIYRVQVTSTYQNLTSSYYGIESVCLNATESFGYQAVLSWNITYDNGQTWGFQSVQVAYDWNRTYQFAGSDWYTGWWIHPAVQLGSQVRIDGDAPATNNHLRIQPFTVTDLISLDINQKYYLCWLLTFTTSQQHERFYYDFYTGLLLKATSTVENAGQPVHEIDMTLQSAIPTLLTLHLLHHIWITYDSILLAFIGATLNTLFVFYLIQRIRDYRFQASYADNFKHNA